MEKKLNLLVFTGWPADGKTTLSKRLESETCLRIATDELRKELYPKRHAILPYPKGWVPLWDEICRRRDFYFTCLKNVIIDSCAHTKFIRDKFFNLRRIEKQLKERNLHIDSYLIRLIVDNDERIKRLRLDNDLEGGLFSIERMRKEYQNPEDYKNPKVSLIELANNNLEEQDVCVQTLKEIMG